MNMVAVMLVPDCTVIIAYSRRSDCDQMLIKASPKTIATF